MTLQEYITGKRKELNIKQKDIAEHIGMDTKTFSRRLNNSDIDILDMFKISDLLKFSLDDCKNALIEKDESLFTLDEMGNMVIGKPKRFKEFTEAEKNEYIKELDNHIKEFIGEGE